MQLRKFLLMQYPLFVPFLDYFQKFIIRWNEVLPEIPLYCNDYHTFFPSWLKNYNESSMWDFQKAILYASIENAE